MLDAWEKQHAFSLWQLYQTSLLNYIDKEMLLDEFKHAVQVIESTPEPSLADRLMQHDMDAETASLMRELQSLQAESAQVDQEMKVEKHLISKLSLQLEMLTYSMKNEAIGKMIRETLVSRGLTHAQDIEQSMNAKVLDALNETRESETFMNDIILSTMAPE